MKSMKRKVYRSLTIISIISIILVTSFLVLIFYNFHMERTKSFIKDYAHTVGNYLETSNLLLSENMIYNNTTIRATLIDSSGNILFDTYKDPVEMENHINRPEVQKALENGSGDSIRHSTTLEKDTYYYAILLSNNNILRLAQETDSMLSVFLKILPGVLLVLFLILFISAFISSFLGSKILTPINDIGENMENLLIKNELDTLDIYDELLPFIKTLVKQSEKINLQLKDIKERAHIMETIMSNMNEGLILVDNNKYILSINQSAMNLLNSSKDISYISKSFITLCRNIEINETIDTVFNDHKSHDLILQLNNKYIFFSISPVLSNDETLGAIILMVDYTEKYKAELIRREFSANVSHELKTPLTSINGYAEMIENDVAKEQDIKKFASIIKKEGNRLLDLIDSIIRLSKIEDESIKKELDLVDIYSVGKEILDNFHLMAKSKDIKLEFIGSKTVLRANKSMMEELIYNLLDNAIKYTNKGGLVTLKIFKDSPYTLIKVVDTGIGIPIEDQDRIFERFYMVDKSRGKQTNSTGLGLSIVKHIVEYHKGTIDLSSTPNKGTEITIKIQ
ncbi:sensor histidine kinase [Wansuia hejianensis]|uniref:histidine kinase n=1 Tax=Wansuia hejianensis TaxID=2763667 RepID=A0A926F1W2_9FIRM|nr:ATP-binding protein [Wansuia hejianensis]MBC8590394.1 hypothetical protein [Wansuia hejianensis]